jgi:hypothetical protein
MASAGLDAVFGIFPQVRLQSASGRGGVDQVAVVRQPFVKMDKL